MQIKFKNWIDSISESFRRERKCREEICVRELRKAEEKIVKSKKKLGNSIKEQQDEEKEESRNSPSSSYLFQSSRNWWESILSMLLNMVSSLSFSTSFGSISNRIFSLNQNIPIQLDLNFFEADFSGNEIHEKIFTNGGFGSVQKVTTGLWHRLNNQGQNDEGDVENRERERGECEEKSLKQQLLIQEGKSDFGKKNKSRSSNGSFSSERILLLFHSSILRSATAPIMVYHFLSNLPIHLCILYGYFTYRVLLFFHFHHLLISLLFSSSSCPEWRTDRRRKCFWFRVTLSLSFASRKYFGWWKNYHSWSHTKKYHQESKGE